MSQILVRDLNPDVVEHLKQRARANRRSLQSEVRTILEDLTERDRLRNEALGFARQMRAGAPVQRSDSTDLIREDRER